ncbi:MAG: hypothetical protein Q7S58_16680 [Candidatus Binatus sp.]|uniref:hypothetical protein n=1 Tax=Candidatus Binatus sp. TaxID=2811406 RepID=UPI002724C6E7|nr:hypothetical protein [Candidatus Binatus sp.]MDO8434035.1 hypothetical protein [Candidatus Binatus sp.]
MKGIVMTGVVLALLGLLGLAMPVFTTQHTEEVAKLGDLKLQANKQEDHVIPPLLSEGAIVLGVILIGAGLVTNRR